MAEPKAVEPISLVALERGFAMGRLVHPGQVFQFNPVNADGAKRKLPSWAAPAGTPPKPAPRNAGDLKPKAAQDAVKTKAGQLTGTDLA